MSSVSFQVSSVFIMHGFCVFWNFIMFLMFGFCVFLKYDVWLINYFACLMCWLLVATMCFYY